MFEPELGLMTDLFPCEDAPAQERSLLGEVLTTVEPEELWVARRIVVRLDAPTRGGTTELAIITNLPADGRRPGGGGGVSPALELERAFLHLTQQLDGELDTLAYPRAALFGFALAVSAVNVLAAIGAVLRAAHGEAASDEKVSGYYVANEVRRYAEGLDLVFEATDWHPFSTRTASELAQHLRTWAGHARLAQYRKPPRGPKKPRPKRTSYPDTPHVATAQVLFERTGKLTP